MTDITVKRINIAGWVKPKTASYSHYFREGETSSLCGRWVLFAGVQKADTSENHEECSICRNKLNAIHNEIIEVMVSSKGRRAILETKVLPSEATDITELAHLRAELSNPAVGSKDHLRKLALSLVEALEKAQKSNEFLKGQLSELANYNPDWDKLEASYKSWREIAAELLVAKDRIAELESRTVKLVDCDFGAVQHMSGGSTEYCHGFVDGTQNAIRAITAAGIKWEAE